MRTVGWQLLAVALLSYIVIVGTGYYLLVEPSPTRLIAIEIALSSLLGIGPRPLAVDQLSNAALGFDITALMVGFVLRLTAIAMVAAMFFHRAQKSRGRINTQEWNPTEMSVKSRRN